MSNENFTFQISLTVLDHLGRNLYRSFSTVLGEAISNAWDADAENVQIFLSKEEGILVVKDDGVGMTADDFQNKFLKIGFTKRKDGSNTSGKGRPYIGRKGIGKLALLSCAERITVATKVEGGEYVGGTIDNSKLDDAITSDLTPEEYGLEPLDISKLSAYTTHHDHGTVILLEGYRGGIRNTEGHLRKLLALYFRFSLVDKSFSIFLNGNRISEVDLQDLADATQFVWKLNEFSDPYVDRTLGNLKERRGLYPKGGFVGFIASVTKPRKLAIDNSDERVSVDLFVNGRVRERDILKHIPTARVAESYFYGQIHFNLLEDDIDRFTSSREGVVADDPVFEAFLTDLKKVVLLIIEEWDAFRRKYREEGDSENTKVPRRVRKSEELVNVVTEDFELPASDGVAKDIVDGWVEGLRDDAAFNVTSYAECFIAENLIRKYIKHKAMPLSKEAMAEVARLRARESESMGRGNVSIQIRSDVDDASYLSMDDLANLVEKVNKEKEAGLNRDAAEYKPIRDACAHTALLTPEAKNKLNSVYANIQGRLKRLLGTLKT